MDSTNQKRLPPDVRASRDVFHARLPWKVMVNLYKGSIFVITDTQYYNLAYYCMNGESVTLQLSHIIILEYVVLDYQCVEYIFG